MSHLGSPYLLTVKRRDGKAILPSVPRYTVRPSPFTQAGDVIKIIDLGQGAYIPLHLFALLKSNPTSNELLINAYLSLLL